MPRRTRISSCGNWMKVSSLALRAQSRVVWCGEPVELEVEAAGELSWSPETSASVVDGEVGGDDGVGPGGSWKTTESVSAEGCDSAQSPSMMLANQSDEKRRKAPCALQQRTAKKTSAAADDRRLCSQEGGDGPEGMPAANDADVGRRLALKGRIELKREAIVWLVAVAGVDVEREVGAVAALCGRQRRRSSRLALRLGHPTPVAEGGRDLRARDGRRHGDGGGGRAKSERASERTRARLPAPLTPPARSRPCRRLRARAPRLPKPSSLGEAGVIRPNRALPSDFQPPGASSWIRLPTASSPATIQSNSPSSSFAGESREALCSTRLLSCAGLSRGMRD